MNLKLLTFDQANQSMKESFKLDSSDESPIPEESETTIAFINIDSMKLNQDSIDLRILQNN